MLGWLKERSAFDEVAKEGSDEQGLLRRGRLRGKRRCASDELGRVAAESRNQGGASLEHRAKDQAGVGLRSAMLWRSDVRKAEQAGRPVTASKGGALQRRAGRAAKEIKKRAPGPAESSIRILTCRRPSLPIDYLTLAD